MKLKMFFLSCFAIVFSFSFICSAEYIPETYIPAPTQRIDIYKKIAAIENTDDVDDIADELLDRYGELPVSVENLLSISLIRALASECGFSQIDKKQDDIIIYPQTLDMATWTELIATFPAVINLKISEKPRIHCRPIVKTPIFTFIDDLLKKYIQIKSKKQ